MSTEPLMTMKSKILLLVAAVVVIVLTLSALSVRVRNKGLYFTSKVERGTITDDVQATGTVNAVVTVQVGAQVTGRISRLYADFNSHVHKDQIIAEIDPALFQGTLSQAKADLLNAQANLAAAKADLVKTEATATQTKADFERNRSLANEGIATPQQLDQARANADTAAAAVVSARAQVEQAEAQIKQKRAAVDYAQTNLDYTIIHAPVEGVVVARNVDVGQTVASSLQAPTLFNIAQDLTKMQVDCQIDEADVGNIRPGQEVTFTVDAYPRESFRGHLRQIRLNPTTVQNVVTYDTVVAFNNIDGKLFPGMTAYVRIPVAIAQNVVEVPNTALRYKPGLSSTQLQAIYAKYEIDQAAMNGRAAGDAATNASLGIVWKLGAEKSFEPVLLRTGVTDHTKTEVVQVVKGDLTPGDELVLGDQDVTGKAKGKGPGPSQSTGH